ncbi:MAG: GNAT family N-acetyltransferase [Oscillospiraceae bacterium]|nr:GNAT family N-acetyltransferase [Oscillospiraceae bacterium]
MQSLWENHGVASALLRAAIDAAKAKGCARIWLIITNDNIHAIRFYQKFGFDLAALHHNAVAAAREIKPSIPLIGEDGIPIRHELEFAFLL